MSDNQLETAELDSSFCISHSTFLGIASRLVEQLKVNVHCECSDEVENFTNTI